MINYKRLTEIDEELGSLKDIQDSAKFWANRMRCDLEYAVKPDKIRGNYIRFNVNKRLFFHMVASEIVALKQEKANLLNRKWWQFWL